MAELAMLTDRLQTAKLSRAPTLGKLFTRTCASDTEQYNLVPAKAGKSNCGSLIRDISCISAYGLTGSREPYFPEGFQAQGQLGGIFKKVF